MKGRSVVVVDGLYRLETLQIIINRVEEEVELDEGSHPRGSVGMERLPCHEIFEPFIPSGTRNKDLSKKRRNSHSFTL